MTPPNLHVAHVATDDKAVLRQMEVMGSQPPTEPFYDHGSAPILFEDDVRPSDLGDTLELAPSSFGFPSPPSLVSSSKGKAAAFEYYDNEDLDVEPDPQPSAPPFEAECSVLPSAPLEDGALPPPSAPPEIVDPDDDPTADTDLPQQLGGPSTDSGGPGPSRLEPLPLYRP